MQKYEIKVDKKILFDCCNQDSRAAGGSGPASMKSTIPEEPSVPVKKETDEPKSEALQSLSPYST